MPKPVIGLIGGIGSGKSLVAEEFAKHGGYLISGDKLGHEALRQPGIRDKVVERWGRDVLDEKSEVDRKKVGAIVFHDPEQLQALESFVHPWIETRLAGEINVAEKDEKTSFVVVDAAIMLEAGWNKHVGKLVYVDAPADVRLARLKQQRGWTEQDLEAREKAQWPLEKKKAKADFVIDNSGTPERVTQQVTELVKSL